MTYRIVRCQHVNKKKKLNRRVQVYIFLFSNNLTLRTTDFLGRTEILKIKIKNLLFEITI